MSNDDAKGPSKKVGYRNPPEHTQFRKGQSGNPKGRPKGATSNKKRVRRMLEKLTPVRIGDEVRTLSTLELSLERLVEGVRKGDKTAIARVLALAKEIDKDDEAKAANAATGPSAAEPLTDEDQAIILDHLARQKALKEAF